MMDEATASLDSQSEGVVQQALTRLMEGQTTFVIAHRLSTIIDADKIIFIEKGQVTGSGTHQELTESHELYRAFAEQLDIIKVYKKRLSLKDANALRTIGDSLF